MIWDIMLSVGLLAMAIWLRREAKIMKKVAMRLADKSDLQEDIRSIRKDLLLTAKNPNLARKKLKEKEEYQ